MEAERLLETECLSALFHTSCRIIRAKIQTRYVRQGREAWSKSEVKCLHRKLRLTLKREKKNNTKQTSPWPKRQLYKNVRVPNTCTCRCWELPLDDFQVPVPRSSWRHREQAPLWRMQSQILLECLLFTEACCERLTPWTRDPRPPVLHLSDRCYSRSHRATHLYRFTPAVTSTTWCSAALNNVEREWQSCLNSRGRK